MTGVQSHLVLDHIFLPAPLSDVAQQLLHTPGCRRIAYDTKLHTARVLSPTGAMICLSPIKYSSTQFTRLLRTSSLSSFSSSLATTSPSRSGDVLKAKDGDPRANGVEQPHPYSLQEFRTSSSTLLEREEWMLMIKDPVRRNKLIELRSKFEVEELEWKLFHDRVDRFNRSFWSIQSRKFDQLESGLISPDDNGHQRTIVEGTGPRSRRKEETGSTSPTETTEATTATATAIMRAETERTHLGNAYAASLDKFYGAWLMDQRVKFMEYNLRWWSFLPNLIRGGWKSQIRNLRWKWIRWKYSLSR